MIPFISSNLPCTLFANKTGNSNSILERFLSNNQLSFEITFVYNEKFIVKKNKKIKKKFINIFQYIFELIDRLFHYFHLQNVLLPNAILSHVLI